MLELSPTQRRALRARAHSLNPVVSISENGLTESVMKEIDVCLKAHELIKIRVYGDGSERREEYLKQICAELNCAPVQHIGKLLVVWRPAPPETARKPAKRGAAGVRSTKRSMQGSTPK
jgi:RNA-binding protein